MKKEIPSPNCSSFIFESSVSCINNLAALFLFGIQCFEFFLDFVLEWGFFVLEYLV